MQTALFPIGLLVGMLTVSAASVVVAPWRSVAPQRQPTYSACTTPPNAVLESMPFSPEQQYQNNLAQRMGDAKDPAIGTDDRCIHFLPIVRSIPLSQRNQDEQAVIAFCEEHLAQRQAQRVRAMLGQ